MKSPEIGLDSCFGKLGLSLAAFLFITSPSWAAPVVPQLTGSTYVFTFPDNGPRMVVDPAPGGRITSLKVGTTELLYLSTANNNLLWGSVFWYAPQTDWNWPPPAAHNTNPYTASLKGNVLVLVGGIDNASKLSFTKNFSGESADTSILLTYVIKNGGTAAKQAAPWADTRVLPGGLTFWAKGPGPMKGQLSALVKEQGGWVWFDHAAGSSVSGNIPKVFADGSGWLAHVNSEGQLLLMVFPDIAQSEAAPGEAETEIYTEPSQKLMEIEHQGAYASIRAGDSLAYTIRWYLRQLPSGAQKAVGNAGLTAFVQSLLNRGPTGLAADPGNRKGTGKVQPAGVGFRALDRKSRPVDAQGRRMLDGITEGVPE